MVVKTTKATWYVFLALVALGGVITVVSNAVVLFKIVTGIH